MEGNLTAVGVWREPDEGGFVKKLKAAGLMFAAVVLAGGAAQGQMPAPLLARPSSLPPMKSLAVLGQKIAYYEVGTGSTLVLVHGVLALRPILTGDW